MRLLTIALLILLIVFQAIGQVSRSAPVYRGKRSSDPATCSVSIPTWYFDTVSNTFKYCSATNTWSSMGGGGVSIGDTVSGLTAGSVLFGGTSGVFAQDNTNFFWDNSNKQLILKQSTNYVSPLNLWENAQHPYGYWIQFSDNNGTSLGEIRASNSDISVEPVNGFRVERYNYNGGSVLMNVSTANANPFKVVSGQATSVPVLIQLATSQSADALQIKNSSGDVISKITADGYFMPGNQTINYFGIQYRESSVYSLNYSTPILEWDPGNGRINNPNNYALTFDYVNGVGGYSVLIMSAGSDVTTRASAGYGTLRIGTSRSAGDGGTLAFGNLTPAQITGDQNDYDLTGVQSRSKYVRLSSDASRNITGINLGQVDGQEHVFVNVGSNNIVLKNESASSTAANRFTNSTGADITLAANQAADCFYDGTSARWRCFKRN